jgi:flagellar basal body-associated protein FliL
MLLDPVLLVFVGVIFVLVVGGATFVMVNKNKLKKAAEMAKKKQLEAKAKAKEEAEAAEKAATEQAEPEVVEETATEPEAAEEKPAF